MCFSHEPYWNILWVLLESVFLVEGPMRGPGGHEQRAKWGGRSSHADRDPGFRRDDVGEGGGSGRWLLGSFRAKGGRRASVRHFFRPSGLHPAGGNLYRVSCLFPSFRR
jgi:hypothetical protein